MNITLILRFTYLCNIYGYYSFTLVLTGRKAAPYDALS